MELPRRKPIRLKGYDYSRPGWYFITICTKDKQCILWEKVPHFITNEQTLTYVGETCGLPSNDTQKKTTENEMIDYTPHDCLLSYAGTSIRNEMNIWNEKYENVRIDRYVIMPNHIHAIVVISANNCWRPKVSPTALSGNVSLMRMIAQFKGAVTKKIGVSIWQKSFHDHIIRNSDEYKNIAQYIKGNPYTWKDDCFYSC